MREQARAIESRETSHATPPHHTRWHCSLSRLFVWLFQTANRAFFVHAACGFACGTLALERGQPIVPSVGRGFISGVIAVVDMRQLPTQNGTVRERGGEKEQEQERGSRRG